MQLQTEIYLCEPDRLKAIICTEQTYVLTDFLLINLEFKTKKLKKGKMYTSTALSAVLFFFQ